MTEAAHARAGRLMDEERIEGILSDADHAWLAEHLRDCEQCSHVAGETNRALASLRSVGLEVPRGLASRTQLRVRLRADALRERTLDAALFFSPRSARIFADLVARASLAESCRAVAAAAISQATAKALDRLDFAARLVAAHPDQEALLYEASKSILEQPATAGAAVYALC